MALTVLRAANDGAHILEFEGITIRSDVLDVLQAIVEQPLTAPDVARKLERSPGATARNLCRFLDLGLVETSKETAVLRGPYAPRNRVVTLYATSERGRRLLQAADLLKADDHWADLTGDDDGWPKRLDPAIVVRQAMSSQPNSVFDMGRLALVAVGTVSPGNRPAANAAFRMSA